MKKVIFFILGIILILLGVIGLILPIVPGWPLLLLGLSFIAPKLAERLKQRFYRKFSKKEVVYLEGWKKLGVDAGFTTRHFPLFVNKTGQFNSEETQESFLDHLSKSVVLKNHGVAFEPRFVFLDQVHGSHVAVLEDGAKYREKGFYSQPKADAVLTNIPDLTLLVLTADCLSIFLSAGPWIGLVLSGRQCPDCSSGGRT